MPSVWTMLGIVAAAYALASAVSFVAYAWDKRAAQKGRWRTRERTLLLIDLLGGWPGGLAAQRLLRHKRRKRSYMIRFALVVLAHVALWVGAVALWW